MLRGVRFDTRTCASLLWATGGSIVFATVVIGSHLRRSRTDVPLHCELRQQDLRIS